MKKNNKLSHLTLLKKEQNKKIPRNKSEINKRSMRAYYEQYWYGEKFLYEFFDIKKIKDKSVLEIGPAEAGLLKFFQEKGAHTTGIELSPLRFSHSELLNNLNQLKLLTGDICDKQSYKQLHNKKYDFIIIRDVIEHIDDKFNALKNMYDLLSDEGQLFISFPPKYCPYAGHQQTIKNNIGKIPYIHLLPNFLYKRFLSFVNHPKESIGYLLATKSTRISVSGMKKLFAKSNFIIKKNNLYFLRPAYKFRFNLPTFKNPFSKIPFLNEIFTNGALFVLIKNKK
tara:strand:+ start:4935 stop:5783 length:849 start_codon:yes stop_codon:yes gene_type:complete